MAKKNDRKEYNKLKKKKADNKKQQEQCRSEIDVLDEKIERLKAAYRKLMMPRRLLMISSITRGI